MPKAADRQHIRAGGDELRSMRLEDRAADLSRAASTASVMILPFGVRSAVLAGFESTHRLTKKVGWRNPARHTGFPLVPPYR
jgi:hypothetical protein